MNISTFSLTLALILNVIYVILAIAAFAHVIEEKKVKQSDRMLALTFWWPFYDDMYDESGQKLCKFGKILLPITATFYIVWAVQI